MNEWNEDRLDQEMDAIAEAVSVPKDLEMRIIRSINKRIRKIVVRSLLVIISTVLAAVVMINPLLDSLYLNPYQLDQKPERTMLNVLRDYYETTYPYRELFSLSVERKGFGRYKLSMEIGDLTEPVRIDGPNVWCDMNWGVYENVIFADVTLAHSAGRFVNDFVSQEEMLQKISELPQSAKIYLSVSDTEPKTVEELRNLPVTPQWMQVYQPNTDFNGGISLRMVTLYADDDNRDEMTAEELLETYLQNLENLVEHSDIWEQMLLYDGRNQVYSAERLQDTWEDAKTLQFLTSKNYCVFGQRDEVIRFLQDNTLNVVTVENVRLW